jgi:hypothetical protein
MLSFCGRMSGSSRNCIRPNMTNTRRDPRRSSGASRMSTVRLRREDGPVGNCETRLFFAFVGPIFRLVNELAGRAGVDRIRQSGSDRGPGAANARTAVRTHDAERALLLPSDRSTHISYDRTPAALPHPWTRLVATSSVVLNPVRQLPTTNVRFPHCGGDRRCNSVARRRVLPKPRAGDSGRGGAAATPGLSLRVYPDPAANRATTRRSAGTLSLALRPTPRRQQADTDGYGCRNMVVSREAGLG